VVVDRRHIGIHSRDHVLERFSFLGDEFFTRIDDNSVNHLVNGDCEQHGDENDRQEPYEAREIHALHQDIIRSSERRGERSGCSPLEKCDLAFALPPDHDATFAEVQDCGRLETTRPAVHDRIHILLQALADLLGIGHWQLIARKD